MKLAKQIELLTDIKKIFGEKAYEDNLGKITIEMDYNDIIIGLDYEEISIDFKDEPICVSKDKTLILAVLQAFKNCEIIE